MQGRDVPRPTSMCWVCLQLSASDQAMLAPGFATKNNNGFFFFFFFSDHIFFPVCLIEQHYCSGLLIVVSLSKLATDLEETMRQMLRCHCRQRR
jgi:hypothetical protein